MNRNQRNQDVTFQTNCEVKCRSEKDGCSIIINVHAYLVVHKTLLHTDSAWQDRTSNNQTHH